MNILGLSGLKKNWIVYDSDTNNTFVATHQQTDAEVKFHSTHDGLYACKLKQQSGKSMPQTRQENLQGYTEREIA